MQNLAPTESEILCHLGEVLASRGFFASPTLKRLLTFLVERALTSPESSLTGREVGARVFQRGSGFRNGEDSIVRSSINRLRRALTVYYATEGAGEDVEIAIEPGSYVPHFRIRTRHMLLKTERAIETAQNYQHSATREAHSNAFCVVNDALRQDPDHPLLLSSFADLSLDAFKHGFDHSEERVDQACRSIEKAEKIAPEDDRLLFAKAMLALEFGETDKLDFCVSRMTSNASPDIRAQGSWFLAVQEVDNGRSRALLDGDRLSESLPGWYKLPRYLNRMLAGDYEGALSAAIDFGMPGFFWGPMVRASSLGQLGLLDVASVQLRIALRLNPELANTPHKYLKCYVPDERARLLVLEGLEKAGLHKA